MALKDRILVHELEIRDGKLFCLVDLTMWTIMRDWLVVTYDFRGTKLTSKLVNGKMVPQVVHAKDLGAAFWCGCPSADRIRQSINSYIWYHA